MAVGGGRKIQNFQKPIREGFGQPHKTTLARLHSDPEKISKIFWDYGSPSCYISDCLSKFSFPYNSRHPSVISGIGSRGQPINQDAIISFQLATNNGWSDKITISCGIVKNRTFPGEICLGQSIYHQFGFYSDPKGRVKLLNFPNAPLLQDCDAIYTTNETLFPTNDVPNSNSTGDKNNLIHPLRNALLPTIPIHRDTPKWAHRIVLNYANKFPSLFDASLRMTSKMLQN